MTTIACRDGVMAADMQANLGGGGLMFATAKIFELTIDGGPALFGGAGDAAVIREFAEWLESGRAYDLPQWCADAMKDGNALQALVLVPGRIGLFADRPRPIWIESEFIAVGSGAQAAMGAMHMAADAEMAVKIAAVVDEDTGSRVVSRSLGGVET